MSKQKIFNIALKAFLLLSPIFFFRDFQPSFAQGLFFLLAPFVLFGISLGLERKRNFSNPWLALFLLFAFARMFIGNDFGNNPAMLWFNFWLASASFMYVFAGVLLFYTVYCHAESPKKYLAPIFIVCIMNFFLVIAQVIGYDFLWFKTARINGFMGLATQLGQYSTMALPILAYINPVFIFIAIFTLLMAKNMSAVLALFVGLGFFIWHKHNRLLLIPLLLAALIFGFIRWDYIVYKATTRSRDWQKTLKVALQKPYIGHGYRTFDSVVSNNIDSVGLAGFNKPNSDPIHTAQEMGFPMLIIIGGFFYSLWRKFKTKQNKDMLIYLLATSVLMVLVNGSIQTLIRYANMAGTFIVILAFLHIKLEGEGNDHVHI